MQLLAVPGSYGTGSHFGERPLSWPSVAIGEDVPDATT